MKVYETTGYVVGLVLGFRVPASDLGTWTLPRPLNVVPFFGCPILG